ncbi:MAG: exodeoxyribonuclease VII large subunit [Opitutaceae bacterium]|nr:exodeoxyribonuclease VII large subunit [Verrucomicrobiales bacterium]
MPSKKMAKPGKSQWDFGELFPMEATRQVLSVTDLTGQIRRLLEKQIGQIWVSGEITNLRAQSSGHIYFTLKDATCQLSCVLFRGEARETRDLLADGQKVVLQGEITVYEPRGQYQLRVTAAELQGIGALQAAFEKLKRKLEAEGLFTQERKRAIPRYPQRIALVTSPTGAAIRDVLHVFQRRQPGLEIVLVPCRVQGQGAADEIASAIRLLNHFNETAEKNSALPTPRSAVDLILVTRGGGSLEDLWAFNEEVVARAIFESALPVISAVGHEIDFTISDFVADLRAATPSAAAELITEGTHASREFVADASGWMRNRVRQRLAHERDYFEQLTLRLRQTHPRRRLNDHLQRLDDLNASLARCARTGLRQQRQTWTGIAQRLIRLRPSQLLAQRSEKLCVQRKRLVELTRQGVKEWQNRFSAVEAKLRLLSPEQVLARGYSITTDAVTGKVIRRATDTAAGQTLKTRLHTGEIVSRVEE